MHSALEVLYRKKVVFFGGKGGVGKSTTASAFALQAAAQGWETLLISTDPAHNLGDIFERQLQGTIQKLAPHLSGLEIDPDLESKRYIQQVKQNLQGLVKPQLIEEIHRQIDMARVSPGADESALFDRMVSLLLEEEENYDLLVFDTAPTGHTIRLLSLPELMGAWIDGMLNRREKINENYSALLGDGEPVEDPIYQTLQKRKERFAKARRVLLDPGQTAFVFVLIPERLPITETKKAVETLQRYDVDVPTLIVNKMLPSAVEGHFFQQRKKQEDQYVQQIKETFSNKQLLYLPLLAEDISSRAALEEVSTYFSYTVTK